MSEYHSLNGPSTLHRRLACPGSMRLEKDKPDTQSEHAMLGSLAHAVAEFHLLNDRPRDAMVATVMEQLNANNAWKEALAPVDHENLCNAVNAYLYHLDALEIPEESTLIETRVDLSAYDQRENGGTADFVGFKDGTLYVRDYKHGQGVWVGCKDNPQLLAYAIGAVDDLEFLFGEITHVDYGVVQPRCNNNIASEVITVDELKTWSMEVLAKGLRVCNSKDAPLKAGDHCQFCRAKGDCPALTEFTAQTALTGFENLEETPLAGLRDVDSLAPDEVSFVLKHAKVIRDFLKAVETRAFDDLCTNDKAVPDYKLVMGNEGNRAWIDEASAEKSAINLARKDNMRKADVMVPPKLLSPTQLEKKLGKIEGYEKFAWRHVTRPPGKKTLAPASDKRAAIITDHSDMPNLENDETKNEENANGE